MQLTLRLSSRQDKPWILPHDAHRRQGMANTTRTDRMTNRGRKICFIFTFPFLDTNRVPSNRTPHYANMNACGFPVGVGDCRGRLPR